ncbi:MAG: ParB N-terminal domain-containing protein [Pleurocapsa sp.]
MTLSPSLVEVRTIASDQPRSNFDERKIEKAAQLIIEAEGIINPIIVSRTGINSFQVLHGHLEYHAAARARELNLEIGEAIAAYIVDEENKATIEEQVNIFRESQEPKPIKGNVSNLDLEFRLTNFESRIENWLTNFESRIENRFNELEQEIDNLKHKLPEQIEPLTTFNQASKNELVIKLKPILRSDKKANDIAPKIIEARPFKSLNEVLENVKGLGDKTMLRVIDSWLYS